MMALQETMGSLMDTSDQGDSERQRQKQQAKAVDNRGLKKGVQEEVEEADEEKAEEEAPEKREDRTGGKGTKDSEKLDTPSKKSLKTASIGSVIDKLNALRGGRSLKDPEVQKSFKQYFGALTVREKQSLLVFLTGIAQILAGTKQGTEALDLEDVGLKVKGKTPDVSKESEPKKVAAKDGKSDQPIVVGESVKRRMKAAIKAYKKNGL